MNKKQIRQNMNKLFTDQVPDQFDEILLKCKKLKKERKVTMLEKSKFNWKLALTTFCILLLVSGSGLFYNYSLNAKVDSIIDIDVNPSIELKINKKEKIVDFTALNDDAKKIIEDMDLKGVDIDIALNAIIGSMVTKGYLNDLANSILISVDNNDKNKAEQIRTKLVNKIDNILNSDKIQGSVLSQTLDNQLTEADKLAKKYDISLGKAQLILSVLETNTLLKEEDLVGLTINEINVLTKKNVSKVEITGNASTKAYIGEEKAKQIALNHAKVTKYNKLEVEFDVDYNVIVYDVEFETNTYEYDYEINALDGKIVNYKKEKNNDYNPVPDNNSSSSNFITSTKARQIALNHAKASNASNVIVKLDREDQEYSVEFIYNNKEYDYEINAVTGKIIKYDIENIDSSSSNSSSSNFITSTKARQIALNHAKVSNVSNVKVKLDREDQEYSVEFIYNNKEYDYEINAVTGKIIDYDIENIDDDEDD